MQTFFSDRRITLSMLAWIVLLGVTWPVGLTLHEKWTYWSGAYSHGYPLLIFVGIALYRRIVSLRVRIDRFSVLIALCAALVVGTFWFLADATQILIVQQLLLPVAIGCILLLTLGSSAWALVPIVAMLFLVVPVWEVAVPLLQGMSVAVADTAIGLMKLAVFVENETFTTPYGRLQVADSCSGLAYFLMALTLGSIWAVINRVYARQAVVGILILVMLSLIGNWIRIISLILIAYYSQMQHPLVYEHAMFGWYIFAGVFALFLLIVRHQFFSGRSDPEISQIDVGNWRAFGSVRMAVFVLLITVPAFNLATSVSAGSAVEIPPNCLPVAYQGYDRLTCEMVKRGSQRWSKLELIYDYQTQGKELIQDGNQISRNSTRVISDDGKIQTLEIETPDGEQMVEWSYRINGQLTTRALQGKWLQIFDRFNPQTSPTLVVYAELSE